MLTATGRLEEAEEARRQSLANWESAGTPVLASFSARQGAGTLPLGRATAPARSHRRGPAAVRPGPSHHGRARAPPTRGTGLPLAADLSVGQLPGSGAARSARAVALAQRVLPPSAGHYWRYLALAQYRSQQWQDAADSIQQAMDLRQGGDAFDWFLLAMAQWQLGQKDTAVEKYAQAQEAIQAGKPLFYEYLGVMAVQRLQREAEMLMGEEGERMEEAVGLRALGNE